MILPRNDLVLIERIDEAYKGRIIFPEVAMEQGMRGMVLAVGPGKLVEGIDGNLVRRPLDVQPGEIVYFNSKWSELSGTHYSADQPVNYDQKLHLVFEADIFCKANKVGNAD